jgi:hypothetical protein
MVSVPHYAMTERAAPSRCTLPTRADNEHCKHALKLRWTYLFKSGKYFGLRRLGFHLSISKKLS